jgi:peptidoglycan/xylan/chitin deacetylase (PgdA/CDA1 family)
VVKLAAPNGSQPPAALRVLLPKGAVCRQTSDTGLAKSPAAMAAAGSGACDAGPSPKSWQEWTDNAPPGVCYELYKACAGLPDHVAYLTFDDGPIDWTPTILDTLRSSGVHATFFVNARGDEVTGRLEQSYRDGSERLVYYRDVLKRIVDEGHALGNHTRDHADLGTLTQDQVVYQYEENERVVNDALLQTGAQPRPLTLLRPPFGSPWTSHAKLADPKQQQSIVGLAAMRFGYNALWNIDSTDSAEWAPGEAPTYEELRKANLSNVPPEYTAKVDRLRTTVLDDELVQKGAGVVVLMHDTHNTTRDALPDIIAGLRARGYTFDTLENQVTQQYGRSSLELTPGPALDAACSKQERARSCLHFDATGHDVCGRFWLAFEQLGGEPAIGRPISDPQRAGVISQQYERGRIDLHPEWPAPCDIVFVPTDGEAAADLAEDHGTP